MSYSPPSYSNPDPRAVGIIGLSISSPGGEAHGLDTEAFYEFLSRRGSGIITVPANRWNAQAFHGTSPGKISTTKGGFIPDFSYADLQEFGIPPAEASQVAFSQYTLLHQAFSALQRSGVDSRGSKTGVYVGCAGGLAPYKRDITQTGAYYMTGNSLAITSNRINYVFDFLGPSLAVDTACSSSLTAMHLAFQAIRNGDCDQAVVAGVNFAVTPIETSSFSQLGVLSPEGISKAFDDEANGYARGDVASAVVIKRHDLAVRDNDRIHATLVGSALTSCGSIMGSLTTPNPEAQSQAIREAYLDAGLTPNQADFVELHGTGTIVGDSLEANAAGALFAEGRNGREIIIGSVKSNVGHGEMGAYMTSLVKVVLMLERKQILPNGYFNTPSRKIDFEKYNLRVPTVVEDMVAHDAAHGLIASISSYGFGGSCGHTVLREHEIRPTQPDADTLQKGPFLFTMGALTPKALHSLIRSYKEECAGIPPLLLCDHLGGRTRQMPWRAFAVADSLEAATFPDPVMVGKRPDPLIYCFSGQGPQHWQQGHSLMAVYPAFRESIYACDRVHKEYTGRSFLEDTGLFVVDAPESSLLAKETKWPADIISVAIAFFQIALFDLLSSLGVKPDAIIGHSIGETAVLYASGAMPRDMVTKIAVARGRALALVDDTGGSMVAISGCDANTVRDYIDAVSALAPISGPVSKSLYMAVFNSPTDTGVSGSDLLVDILIKYISNWVDGLMAKKLRVSTAVHSPFVDPCEDSYRSELATIFSQHTGPFIPSTLTMSTVTASFKYDEYTVDYLWSNLRQPVLFSAAVPKIVDKFGEKTTFLEISPHPILSKYIKHMGASDSLAASTRPPSAPHLKPHAESFTEVHTFLQAIGQLLICGINSINFSILNGCPSGHFDSPGYPFQMKFLPFMAREASNFAYLLEATRPLNSSRLRVSPNLPEPWMSHHIIDHSNLVPGAAYIEMALEFPNVTQVWDCHFESLFIVEESIPPGTLEVAKDGINWTVKSSSALETMQGDLEWTRSAPEFDVIHAYGKLGYGKPNNSVTKVDVDAVLARCTQTHLKDELYATVADFVQFGPEFMRVNKASVNDSEAICWIRGPIGLNTTGYTFHPALIDAVFQTPIGWNMLYEQMTFSDHRPFLLPHSLRRGYRNDGSSEPLVLPDEFRTYTVRTDWSPYHWVIDAYVLDEDNDVLFTFEGLRFAAVTQDDQWPTKRYMTYWQPRALPQTALQGTVVLEGPSKKSETTQILRLLDQMALKYTAKTLKAPPGRFKTELSSDRKRYLAWARELSQKHGVPAAPEITSAIQEKYHSLLELTERVGTRQKDIMMRSTVAVEVLFRDDIMSKIYDHPPFVGPVFDQTVAKFVELVENAISAKKRVIRVLEVGAGTGRLTALLGQALLDAKLGDECYVDYICTDVSISLAVESTAKSPWPTMTPMTFDLNVPLERQSLDPASFDIVVAFDVLHATSSIHDSLAKLHDLLLPGGHLAIIELDGSSFASHAVGTIWMDFVFGSFAEWMGVLDHRPGSTHCSLSPTEWESALDTAGYVDTLLMTSSGCSVAHLAFISQNALVPVVKSRGSSGPTVASSSSLPSQPYLNGSAIRPNTSIEHDIESTPALPGDLARETVPHESEIVGKNLTIVRSFSAGGEVDLVHFLSSLDSMKPHTVWLYTDTEESNSTLIGLVRSIRHEFTLWKVMMVLFHPSWDQCRKELFIYERLMSLKWVDSEVLVDDEGSMRVPRIITAPAPPQTEARENKPVEFDKSLIWRAFPPPLGPEDVEITVTFMSLSPAFAGCSEFSGQVAAVGPDVSSPSLLGKRVFGISSSKQGNVIVCNRSQVALIPLGMHPSAAAATVGRICFISSVVKKALVAAAVKKPRVLLHAGNSSPAAIATYAYLKANSFDVVVTVNGISNLRCVVDPSHLPVHTSSPCHEWSFRARKWAKKGVDLAFNFDNDRDVTKETINLLSKRGTLVQIGGAHDPAPSIRCGQSYMSIDYHRILDDEDIVQSALTVVQPTARALFIPPVEIFELGQLSAARARSQRPSITDTAVLLDLQVIDSTIPILRGGAIRGTSVFNPRAAYIVIGGVGGLGASIAQCLIENGARHVVLTSRSGEDAFKPGHLIREKQIIKHLRRIPGVSIDILAVDCLDVEKTKQIFANTSRRVAGVFFLPVRLNDQLFINLTATEDWQNVHNVKVKGLKVLLEAVDPSSLDFLVLTSSLATVTGSPGQSNYTASQTEMEAIGASLPNTVTVAVPPISDGGVFMRNLTSSTARNAALAKYKSLGMPGIRVAEHCIDAIWTLNTTAANPTYIPPMNWKMVAEMGIPSYYLAPLRHLLAEENAGASLSSTSIKQSIHGACANVLALDFEDIETDVPLSSYGLDSLTSVRLSTILKQYFDTTVTQLQLLSSHITVEKLEAMQEEQRVASASSAPVSTSDKSDDDGTGPSNLDSDIDKTVVHLNAVTKGRPIFILHGAGGGVLVMQKLAQKINYPVYGVQDTPDAPITGTLDRLSRFYLSKIKEKQPFGPYRLGGFSFGTALAVAIGQILHAEGAIVEVLILLDGAPTLFHRPMFHDYTKGGIREGKFREHILEIISDMSTSGCLDKVDDITQQFVDHFQKIDAGSSGPSWVARFCKTFAAHILMGLRASIDASKREEEGTLKDDVWPSKRAVLVRADKGVASQPYAEGASRFFDLDRWVSDVELHEVPGSHFGILNPDSGLTEIINEVLK